MVPFLTGLQTAKRRIRSGQLEKMVRKMAEKGGLGVVMEIARRVEDTGMKLGDVGVTREIMWGAVWRCMNSGYTEEAVRDGAKFVNAIWEMLSEERHVDKTIRGRDGDPKTNPEIAGVVMWMRAVQSTLFSESKDPDDQVKKAVETVLAVWKNADLKINEEGRGWYDANHKLLMWAPVWHGMKISRKILGQNTSLGRDLTSTITLDLEPTIQKAIEVLSRNDNTKRRGLGFYEMLEKAKIG
ncbi:MAG: hypothetical protein Q9224_007401 [Gallowayella concinna]